MIKMPNRSSSRNTTTVANIAAVEAIAAVVMCSSLFPLTSIPSTPTAAPMIAQDLISERQDVSKQQRYNHGVRQNDEAGEGHESADPPAPSASLVFSLVPILIEGFEFHVTKSHRGAGPPYQMPPARDRDRRECARPKSARASEPRPSAQPDTTGL